MQQLCSLLLGRIQLLEIVRKFPDSNLQSSHSNVFLFPPLEKKKLRTIIFTRSRGGILGGREDGTFF
jgi:hypothetical protein